MKAEVGILAVKASWIIYFAMLLSSCSEIRINQIADWMEKQEEVKFFFNIVKDNHIQLNSAFTIPLMNTLYCVQLLWFLQQGKSVLFFVTTDACAVNWKWYIDLKFITNELNQRHILLCHGAHLMYGLKYSTAGEKDLRAVPLQWNVLQITYSSFHNLLYLIFHYSSYTYCECGTMLFYLIYLFIFCHKISKEQFFSKMYRELNDTNFKPEIG